MTLYDLSKNNTITKLPIYNIQKIKVLDPLNLLYQKEIFYLDNRLNTL